MGEFNESLTKDRVLAKVPAFSPGILRVIDLLSKENGSVVPLAQAISADPTLAAQVLRLANSALFGSQCRIDTVQKAVVAVGHSWIQHLTLTLGVNSYMKAANQTEELKRCWRHMLATAVLSRELAKAAGLPTDRSYAVGLLHDIGRLGLLAAFPTQYAGAIDDAARLGVPLLALEGSTFGIDHCDLGRCMVESWNLPAQFGQIVGRHHEAVEPGELGIGAVVQLACRLADALGFFFVPPAEPITLDKVRETLPPFAQNRFPAEEARLVEIVEESMAENELGPAESFEPAALPPPPAQPAQVVEIRPARHRRWVGPVLAATLLIAAIVARLLW